LLRRRRPRRGQAPSQLRRRPGRSADEGRDAGPHYRADLRILAAFGVNHVCSDLPSRRLDETWSADGLTKLRERVESHGIKLEMVPLPELRLHHKAENPNIMLARPGARPRDR